MKATRAARLPTRGSVDVVVPVYNEEADLEASLRRLRAYLDDAFPFPAVVTVVDNGSTDATLAIARRLAEELPGLRVLHLPGKGRGRALRAAWSASEAEVVCYMDVDLSTGLEALLPLVAPVLSGHSDLAIGTRLSGGSRVVRGPKRELVSRAYNGLLSLALHKGFSDAQCGFKAIRAADARALLPFVKDEAWFFDTELLVLAERNGLRIHEVPVDWVDDPDSRVRVARTALEDLKGVLRLLVSFSRGAGAVGRLPTRRRPDAGRLLRASLPGLAGTVAYLGLFLLLQSGLNGYVANVLSLGVCSSLGFGLRRRWPSPSRPAPRSGAMAAVVAFCAGAVATTWALAAGATLQGRSLLVELVALLVGLGRARGAGFAAFGALLYRTHLESGPDAARPLSAIPPGDGPDPFAPRPVARPGRLVRK